MATLGTLATPATLATRVGNQWMVPYPWRKDPNFLSNNKSLALKHLVLTERWLKSSPDHAKANDAGNEVLQKVNKGGN